MNGSSHFDPQVDGTWIPVEVFREIHRLPTDFGIAYFAPKDFSQRGSIEGVGAGAALRHLYRILVDSIPAETPDGGWMAFTLHLQRRFTHLLIQINPVVGLHPSEIEFAAIGFGDVIRAYVRAMVGARVSGSTPPPFEMIYQRWFDQALLISIKTFPYEHEDSTWVIRLVQSSYGFNGLRVEMPNEVVYVRDDIYLCPAAGFMTRLLRECAAKIAEAG